MPPVIGAVIAVLAPILSTTILGVSVGSILGTVALSGAMIGARALFSRGKQQTPTFKAPPGPVGSEPEMQPIVARFWSYGRQRLGPPFFFREVGGYLLGYGGVLNCRKIQGTVARFIDDELPTYATGLSLHSTNAAVFYANVYWDNEGPNVQWPSSGRKFVMFYTYIWDPNQGAIQVPAGQGPAGYLEFRNASPDGAPSDLLRKYFSTAWTNEHKGRDLACLYSIWQAVSITDRTAAYPRFFPVPSIVLDGALVFDPRNPAQSLLDSSGAWSFYNPTWTFSTNPALHILDYLTNPEGFALAPERINLDAFKAAANDCDRVCPAYGGGYEPFAVSHLTVSAEQERRDVLVRLMAACDGFVFEDPWGRASIWIRKWVEPTLVLTAADISEIEIVEMSGVYADKNYVQPSYVEPRNNFTKNTSLVVRDEESISFVGERRATMDFEAVQNFNQAYRLATRALRMESTPQKLTILGGPRLLLADGEFAVRVELPEHGVEGTFAIVSMVAQDLSHVALVLHQVTQNMFEDVVAPLDPVNAALPGLVSLGAVAPPQPAAPTLAIVFISETSALITASVPAPEGDSTSIAHFRMREVDPLTLAPLGDGAWIMMPDYLSQYAMASAALAGAPGSTHSYEIAAWFMSPLGAIGPMSGSAFIAILYPT